MKAFLPWVIGVVVGATACSSSATPNVPDSSAAGLDAAGADGGAADADAAPDAGNCVPCKGTEAGTSLKCTQVKDPVPGAIAGAMIYLTAMAQPDGTCVIGAITLSCGGTGTFADGTPLTWTLAGGTVTFQDAMRIFSCVVQ